MKKIILKDCNVKRFQKLISRVSAIDNFVVFTIEGATLGAFSCLSGNKVIKYVETNLEKYVSEGCFKNEYEGKATAAFVSISKIATCLHLFGDQQCTMIFEIANNGFCHKLTIKSQRAQINLPCAEDANIKLKSQEYGVPFYITDQIRDVTIGYSDGIFSEITMDGSAFKQLTSMFNIDQTSSLVYFSSDDPAANQLTASEIEPTDRNKEAVSSMMCDDNTSEFNGFEKVYSLAIDPKKIYTNFISAFSKKFFKYIDIDSSYEISIHDKMMKVVSVDNECDTVTHVCIAPTVCD